MPSTPAERPAVTPRHQPHPTWAWPHHQDRLEKRVESERVTHTAL
ncbi:hypothetical protein ACFTWS_21185 [Streptomyces sp. NPDC057027]